MTKQQKLKFLQEYYKAMEEGKTVQFCNPYNRKDLNPWIETPEDYHPHLGSDLRYWRIKPEPVCIWVAYENDSPMAVRNNYQDAAKQRQFLKRGHKFRVRKFVEEEFIEEK